MEHHDREADAAETITNLKNYNQELKDNYQILDLKYQALFSYVALQFR